MTLTERHARVYREVPESTRDRFYEIESAVLDYADLSYLPEAEALLAAMPAFSRRVLGEQFARCVAFALDTCGPSLWGDCEVPATDPASRQEVRYWYVPCSRRFGDCEEV